MRSLLPAPAGLPERVQACLSSRYGGSPDAAPTCPRCGQPLDLCGYRLTETSYVREEVIACPACTGQWLLSREERV